MKDYDDWDNMFGKDKKYLEHWKEKWNQEGKIEEQKELKPLMMELLRDNKKEAKEIMNLMRCMVSEIKGIREENNIESRWGFLLKKVRE